MESLFLLIPIALLFVAAAVKAFFWAVDNNQFDDLDAAAERILFDEDEQTSPPPGEQDKHTDNPNHRDDA